MPLPRDANGRRRQHRFTFIGNKKDAQKALVAEEAAIGCGNYVERDRTTFGQYITAFLAGSKAHYAPKTQERFEGIARLHVIPKLGDVPLQKLSASNLNAAYAEWGAAEYSATTVLHHHRFVHIVLAQALRESRVQQNVAAVARKPKLTRREMRFLSDEELAKLLATASGTPLEAIVTVGLASGARLGELCGAKWDDLDARRGTLSIRRSLQQTKAGVSEKPPKSGKARIITLPESASEALRRHRIAQARLGPGYIFAYDDAGNPWAPYTLSKRFSALASGAGLQGVTFHTMRHTHASQLLAAGVHPKVVQERLGHSTIAITMDLYSHVSEGLQAEAAVKLDAVLRPVLASVSGSGA
ncbi:MAG TPA: tyrosine-type recombinase/integrase [Candidatus Dormibacteraeota bacterium]|nr:tyrosine-type recombinase/integrase [Candidatus Dormibacteraeota bacterium]